MTTPQTTTPAKPRRERPKAVRLTDSAASRIRDIMADAEGKYQGVRVGVTNGGCAGMSYTMDYAEDVRPLDEVVEDKGVKNLHRAQGDPVPHRHRDGFRAREAWRPLCVQQPETRLPPAAAAKASRSRRRRTPSTERGGRPAPLRRSFRRIRLHRAAPVLRRRGHLCRRDDDRLGLPRQRSISRPTTRAANRSMRKGASPSPS